MQSRFGMGDGNIGVVVVADREGRLAVEKCTKGACIVSVEGSGVSVGFSCWNGLDKEGWTSDKDMGAGVETAVVFLIRFDELLFKTAVGSDLGILSVYALVGEGTKGSDGDSVGIGDDCVPDIAIAVARNKYKLTSHIVELASLRRAKLLTQYMRINCA